MAWMLVLGMVCAASPADHAAQLRGEVVDAATSQPVASRVYVQDDAGSWHFVRSVAANGSAVPYEKRSSANTNAVEVHTTVSAHPFKADLVPGRYTVVVERGKEYFPSTNVVEIGADPAELRIGLRRWVDMAARGWYSGETHLHRTPDELQNVLLAEDLNVAFPLTFWVTIAQSAPGAGDRYMPGDVPPQLVAVDGTHVLWPRNTEYEIVTVGGQSHTLGALFLLNHRTVFNDGVPPWGPVAKLAQGEGGLLDMDKLDWPSGMVLPAVTSAPLYELANNHLWRTEFGFTRFNSEAPRFLCPPYGVRQGNERQWTLYTLGLYYTLLNCGFRAVPTAGTASGVHPVPAGFSRVYVHLPEGFSYPDWIRRLAEGRSFVTTGPMLWVTVNDRDPGEVFRQTASPQSYRVAGTIRSEQPISFAEVIQNGSPIATIMGQNRPHAEGGYETTMAEELTLDASGWLAVRCWEERPGMRFRFAHTAPWHVEVARRPVRPRVEERGFLMRRMQDEIARSRERLPSAALQEYEWALAQYGKLVVANDIPAISRQVRRPRDHADLQFWLENMFWHHRYSPDEIRAATGLSLESVQAGLDRFNIRENNRPATPRDGPLKVLPYPGGRHPRLGFLDGARDPQRDTKISVFTPWDDRSYVVVDLPEAVFTPLGLTYLAHTHVPTCWDEGGQRLPRLEWTRQPDGTLDSERALPNGIVFGAKVRPGPDAVRMELWLRNGTTSTLTNARSQVCVMLMAAAGFQSQTRQNKVLSPPYAAAGSDDGHRWVITAWDPLHRVWENPPVPCIHSDPRFPDCPPGQTVCVRGWLSFYEGQDLPGELRRLDTIGWREPPRGACVLWGRERTKLRRYANTKN